MATAKLERSQPGVKIGIVSSALLLASKRAALIRGLELLSGETDANDKVFEMGLDFEEILDTLFLR